MVLEDTEPSLVFFFAPQIIENGQKLIIVKILSGGGRIREVWSALDEEIVCGPNKEEMKK